LTPSLLQTRTARQRPRQARRQSVDANTDGWGWLATGGIEAWVHPAFAFYGEGGGAGIKGGAEVVEQGHIDNRHLADHGRHQDQDREVDGRSGRRESGEVLFVLLLRFPFLLQAPPRARATSRRRRSRAASRPVAAAASVSELSRQRLQLLPAAARRDPSRCCTLSARSMAVFTAAARSPADRLVPRQLIEVRLRDRRFGARSRASAAAR
jgi:hypothetical protein